MPTFAAAKVKYGLTRNCLTLDDGSGKLKGNVPELQ
jgi:hypothetical protein